VVEGTMRRARWTSVLALVGLLAGASGCASGRCYNDSKPICTRGRTYCEWDRSGTCRTCTCIEPGSRSYGPNQPATE
jgi:hypothetical protein